MFSGLTLGLMSLNIFELKRKSELGDTEARLVYPIRARGNELLVSLIVGNVLVNAALTVLLDSMLPGDSLAAGLVTVGLATVLITFFGEILPQALLKKHGLRVGAVLAPYILFVMEILKPVAAPLGRLLDRAIGRERQSYYSTEELIRIVEEHEQSEHSDVEQDELVIVRNALKFGDRLVRDVMTPLNMVVSIQADQNFDLGTLKDLQESGHSRFPVYKDNLNDIVGVLYLKDLLTNHDDSLKAREAADKEVQFVNHKQLLEHVLNGFLKTKRHLFIVVNEFGETVGIITIEDIIEEIIGREIVDEFDRYDDLRQVAKLRAKRRPKRRIVM